MFTIAGMNEFRTNSSYVKGVVEARYGVKPRIGRHIHAVNPRGDIIDNGGHIRDGYGVRAAD